MLRLTQDRNPPNVQFVATSVVAPVRFIRAGPSLHFGSLDESKKWYSEYCHLIRGGIVAGNNQHGEGQAMTTSVGSGHASMRYQLHEIISGMLASIEVDSFGDDVSRLAAMFEDLAKRFALFAPLAAGVDPAAVGDALKKLEANKYLEHNGDRYVLTASGRAYCTSNKRTLFNKGDIEQLEEAARAFANL